VGEDRRVWRTIVIDPPWAYQQRWAQRGKGNAHSHDGLAGIFKRGGKGGEYAAGIRGAAAQYDCMSIEQIAALPVGEWAADDAHLYLWTTNAFLRDAFALMEGWGFAYKTTLTWIKHQLGMGMYFRNTTEHVLFGVRGSLKLARRDVPTHFVARRGRHSEKPAVFYDIVAECSPEPRLDVFARKHRFGWDAYGDEVYSAIPVAN
jgi:N6-adenosine-specific RNA methylase IME4